MDERAWWDNSVWDHTDPISQRWPNLNQASTGWKFAAIAMHCASFLIWPPPAEVIYKRNMYQLLCERIHHSWRARSSESFAQSGIKKFASGWKWDGGRQQLAFISHQSWCEGQQTNLMHHVCGEHTSEQLAHWNFSCFLPVGIPSCLTS